MREDVLALLDTIGPQVLDRVMRLDEWSREEKAGSGYEREEGKGQDRASQRPYAAGPSTMLYPVVSSSSITTLAQFRPNSRLPSASASIPTCGALNLGHVLKQEVAPWLEWESVGSQSVWSLRSPFHCKREQAYLQPRSAHKKALNECLISILPVKEMGWQC